MKINLLLITVFLSLVIYAGVEHETGIVGTTRLNGGAGCVCHNLNFNDAINVWIEGPDSVLVSDSSFYKIYLSGGSAVKGGFNLAVMFGTLRSSDSTSYVDFNELTHLFPLEFIDDTVCWNLKYIASDSIGIDTIYSVANSTNGDGNPQVGDEWNFGENFVINIVEEIIPVEFSSFIALQNENEIVLSWTTASETNNSGFEVERTSILPPPYQEGGGEAWGGWEMLGFVKGNGTSVIYNEYSFIDDITKPGIYRYRLKQIDFDGNYNFSNVISLDAILSTFTLVQNYPNPFNPSTIIKFTIPPQQNPLLGGDYRGGLVTLKVYDVLGNEIATLMNEQVHAGSYEVEFSANTNKSELPSGIYIYQLTAGSYTATKKMLLIK